MKKHYYSDHHGNQFETVPPGCRNGTPKATPEQLASGKCLQCWSFTSASHNGSHRCDLPKHHPGACVCACRWRSRLDLNTMQHVSES